MHTLDLTDSAHQRLVRTLEARQNVLSIPHKKALYTLVESFMRMGAGMLLGRWAFPIPTGCGKTTAMVECCAALHHADNTDLSAVICASRIEALCTLKRNMLAAGIPAKKIGLIYASAKADHYSEPCTEDNEQRQFLLISHNRVANKAHLPQFNDYRGKPRSVVVYDESLLVSEIEHFPVDKLTGALGKWIARLALDLRTQPELANISNWLTERLNTIQAAYQGFNVIDDNMLSAPCFTLTIDEQCDWQARFKAEGDDILAEFITVQHLPLRLVRHNTTAAITYQITIPPALTNILVLDASYPIRALEQEDKTLQDAETLPSCQKFQIKFDMLKRYDHVILYRMAHHGGRRSVATLKAKTKKILLDTVRVIENIPAKDEVLVFVYKDRQKLSSAVMLQRELEKAKVRGVGTRIHIQTWGNETSTNEFHTCKHVVLVGILHRDLTELAAQHLGQLDDITGSVTLQKLRELSLSERAHLAYQALSRGCCRTMGAEFQALPMTGYLIEADDAIEPALDRVMPGAVWKEWKPVFADAIAHGQLQTTIEKRQGITLSKVKDTSISCRAFKKSVMGREVVDRSVWKQALQSLLSKNPQWIQADQVLKRVA